MKKIIYLTILFISFIACEDVIDVDVPENNPRLSVDALVRIDESKPITTIQIKTSITSSFFDEIQPTDVEQITITNPDYIGSGALDQNFIPLIKVGPGLYEGSKNIDFFTSGELQLSILHEDQRYLASTSYAPASPIVRLEQGDGTLFSGNETEILVAFTDNLEQDNFYLFDFDFNEYLVTEDEFYPGQTFQFSYFYDDGLDSGQTINVSLLGVDESFYNYMNQLIVQSGGDQGPFQTPAATVRGNLINVTDINTIDSFDNVENSDNFALGYFSVSQTYTASLTIE